MINNIQSSILFIKKNIPKDNIFGAHVAHTKEEATTFLAKDSNIRTLIFDLSEISVQLTKEILQKAHNINSQIQTLIIRGNETLEDLQDLSSQFSLFKVHSNYDEQIILYSIQEALAEYDLQNQNFELVRIIEEQNLKLKSIAEDLEARVLKRNQSIIDNNQKLENITKYHQALVAIIVLIQKSETILDLEKNILKSLAPLLNISWVRIFLENSSSFVNLKNKKNSTQTIFEKKLSIKKKLLATLVLARSDKIKFNDLEKKMLNQISQALAISVDRIINIQKIDYIRDQWQKTFDAITDPLSIINSRYDVLQSNTAYNNLSSQDKNLSKCYKLFFNKEVPCRGCKLNTSFTLDSQKTYTSDEKEFFVTSQKISLDSNDEDLFINHYSDFSIRRRAERQMLESSKLSNLGLIGSSIAHELNNPLAGLITFLQILKQDLISENNNESLLKDITEMEKSALKCKDTVANLLSFTRESGKEKNKIHLSDIINKALRVLSIKTKPLGIDIKFINSLKDDMVFGIDNQLTQAIVSILQNSFESVLEKKEQSKNYTPWIEVELKALSNEIQLDIKDNGLGLGKNNQLKIFTPFYTTKNLDQHRGLGLTIAYQILLDHQASIDLTALSENITCARILFQRPVL